MEYKVEYKIIDDLKLKLHLHVINSLENAKNKYIKFELQRELTNKIQFPILNNIYWYEIRKYM